MAARGLDRALGTLHGIVEVLVRAGWTDDQIKAEVERLLAETHDDVDGET